MTIPPADTQYAFVASNDGYPRYGDAMTITHTRPYATTNIGKRYCKQTACDQYGLPTWEIACPGCLKATSIVAPRFARYDDDD